VIKHAEYPHAQLQSYIITHRTEEARPGIIFYHGNLKNLIQELKAKQAKNIFCDGGSSLLNQLLQLGCIDEIILSIIPVLLGKGTRLFHELEAPLNLHLLKSESFASGLVQVHYRIL
jgi:dihydrofolate reductase